MPQTAFIWLALLLVVLIAMFVLFVRRVSVLVARTRDLERFQRSVAGLDSGLGSVVDPLVLQLDDIRRRSGDPNSLAAGIEETQSALATLVKQGGELRPPRALAELATALIGELGRAARAADLVEHGLAAMVGHRGRELEAQTSLKRAALNLRNARSAAAAIASQVAAVRPADLLQPPPGRADPVPARPPRMFGLEDDDDNEGLSHPRM